MSDRDRQRATKPELLATEVIQNVAEQQEVDPIELSPPLYTAIDTEAIASLFSEKRDGFVRVEFTYLDYNITIEGEAEPRVTVESDIE